MRAPAITATTTAVLASALTAMTFNATPMQAQAAREPGWHVAKVLPAVQQDFSVSASGPGNAWATGVDSASWALDIQRWNGHGWRGIAQPPHLGRLNINNPAAPVGSSSASDAWVFPTIERGTTTRTYALHWHDGHWATIVLPRGASIANTAVLSAAEAWAFGVLGSGHHLAPYDLRWNGRVWRKVRLPGAPYEVSALSPHDIWALGPSTATLNTSASKTVTLAMHWNGSAWASVRVPVPRLPRGGNLDAYLAAAGPHSFWFAYINFDRNHNFLSNGLLRWNHGRWQRLALPAHFTYFLNSAAPDGHGGLWVCSPDQIYHYARGRWHQQHVPGKDPGCNALAWIPRTESGWAVGSIRTASLNLDGAIFHYFQ